MAQAAQETSRAGVGKIESTMTVAHTLMRDWINLWMTTRTDFILSPRMKGLTLSDQQLALNIPFPQDFRAAIRENQAWFVLIPYGQDSWRCQVIKPEELVNSTKRALLKKTYLKVIQQIARAMESRGDQIYTNEDLISLQELARELFEALPDATQKSLANCSPQAVFTTQQR